MTAHTLKSVIAFIQSGQKPDYNLRLAASRDILNGADAADIKAYLTYLHESGEGADDIKALVVALKENDAAHKDVPQITSPENAIDCCGTGGDNAHTYNISTAVALVVAGCGVAVAKHGNRAATSLSGAADILAELGIPLTHSRKTAEEALEKNNFVFLNAPHFHPALKPLAAIRKELAFRTVFNLAGPLVNPAHVKRQMIGVYDKKWLLPFANVLNELGHKRALIVCGQDGLDEVSITTATDYAALDNGTVTTGSFKAADFGINTAPLEAIKGGTPQQNAAALLSLLQGSLTAYRDIVLINAACALWVAGKTSTFFEGVNAAKISIDSGAAIKVLHSAKTG